MRSIGVALTIALAAGCGRAAPPAPSVPEPTTPAPAEPAAVTPPAPDPLRCELAVRALSVEGDAGGVSAPVFVDDGLLIAYLRFEGPRERALIARRVSLEGELGVEHELARDEFLGAPRLVAHDGRAAVTISTRGSTRLVPLDREGAIDPAAPAITLSGWPEAIARGPRGVVATTYRAAALERVGPPGSALEPVPLPPSPSMPEPQEELVACGAEVDLVLRRSGTSESPSIDAHVIGRDGEIAHYHVGEDSGASVAAGPSGFVVLTSAPEEAWNELALRFFDPHGAPRGEPIHLPATDGVRRYARAAALRDGWAITYWDGTGPSLLRVDPSGHALGEVLPLRSGDERGGHTDARLAAHGDALAITWEVHAPAFGHGAPEEQPEHPGPRVAIATCAP